VTGDAAVLDHLLAWASGQLRLPGRRDGKSGGGHGEQIGE